MGTYSALFIDDEYIKKYSPLGRSIDPDEVYPFVSEAQSMYIQDLLGTPLYDSLVQKVANNTTLSSIEWELVETFSKSLAYWAIYLALPHISMKIRNGGVLKVTPENTQATDLSELRYIREEIKNLAEFWAQRTVNFLCQNSSSFPLYNATSKDMYPSSGQYDSDIYLDDYGDYTEREREFLRKYLYKN
jgi:hypothetical protein